MGKKEKSNCKTGVEVVDDGGVAVLAVGDGRGQLDADRGELAVP